MTVVEGELSELACHRHWDAILDVHAKTWIQRRQDWFGRTWWFGEPGLAQSSPILAGGFLYCSTLQTCEFWPNSSCQF